MTGPAIPETSSTNELKKADASVQFHVRDWTRCRVPCASPSTKRTSASIQVPFIQPDVMTPLKCAVPAFQSTAPSNSATKACASAPGPTSQCARTCQTGFAAASAGSICRSANRSCPPPDPLSRPSQMEHCSASTPANFVANDSCSGARFAIGPAPAPPDSVTTIATISHRVIRSPRASCCDCVTSRPSPEGMGSARAGADAAADSANAAASESISFEDIVLLLPGLCSGNLSATLSRCAGQPAIPQTLVCVDRPTRRSLPAVIAADVLPVRVIDAVRVFRLGGIDLVVGRRVPADLPDREMHAVRIARLQSIDLVGRLRLYRLAALLRARHRVGARCRECGSGEGESGDQREAVQFRGHGASPSWVRVREHRLVIILRPYDELPRSRIRAACGSVRDRADDQPAGEPVLATNS